MEETLFNKEEDEVNDESVNAVYFDCVWASPIIDGMLMETAKIYRSSRSGWRYIFDYEFIKKNMAKIDDMILALKYSLPESIQHGYHELASFMINYKGTPWTTDINIVEKLLILGVATNHVSAEYSNGIMTFKFVY